MNKTPRFQLGDLVNVVIDGQLVTDEPVLVLKILDEGEQFGEPYYRLDLPSSNGGTAESCMERAMVTPAQFLERLHQGGKWAYLWSKPSSQSSWFTVGQNIPTVRGAQDVWFGVHPCFEVPPKSKRGNTDRRYIRSQLEYIELINALFAEFDAKDFEPEMVRAALIEYGVEKFKDLPQDAQGLIVDAGKPKALAHVNALDPSPSIVVDSGGGFHAYWLLGEPFYLDTDADRERARRLQAAWVTYTGGDQGAKDMARILRLPGTYNHKYAPPRAVQFESVDLDIEYSFVNLESIVQSLLQKSPSITPSSAPSDPTRQKTFTHADDVASARGHLARLASWRCDNYDSSEGWIGVGMALSELGSDGLMLWENWSQQSQKYMPGLCAKKWATFRPGTGPNDLKLASLRHWAQEDSPRAEPSDRQQAPQITSSKARKTTGPGNTSGLSEPQRFPPLPESARIDPVLGKDACPWLDEYIAFSRKWSPRSFDGYHENTALWVLSTTAARRVMCFFGQPRYTNLMTMLLGRTTIHGKSSAVGIGDQLLRDAGLAFLLAADESTPASFIKSLANKHLPSDYDEMDNGRQQDVLARLCFAGQRGWYYEEFGSCLSSMMRPGGTMADFRGLLRQFDDCRETYERTTIARGSECIENPYLALIANLTPADLKPLARKGSQLWGDGFLARFNFVTPAAGEILRGRYPRGERVIPPKIVNSLFQWHIRLGMSDVRPVQKQSQDGNPKSRRAEVGPLPQTTIGISDAVFEASYCYLDALMDTAERNTLEDLDGCLGRFHVKALRVALLFASFEGSDTIEMRHWARAQEIAERWRLYTYRAYEQVTTLDQSEEAQIQDFILDRIRKLGKATVADLGRYIKKLSASEFGGRCDQMVELGLLEFEMTRKHTKRYFLPARIVE